MKNCSDLNFIALEVINLLAKKDITINEAKHVLEEAEIIIANTTTINTVL